MTSKSVADTAKKLRPKASKPYSPPAVEQASQILFTLASSPAPQMSLDEICTLVGVSPSKAYGILTALEKSGLTKRGKDGKGYALGPGVVPLARKVLDDLIPAEVAEPILDALVEETRSTAVFGVIAGSTVYVAAKRESEGDIRLVMRVGTVMPLTYGAHGKAIVAFLPETEREQLLQGEELYFHVTPEQLDRSVLADELTRCREDGFACAQATSAPGVTVVSAPVMGANRAPMGFVEVCVLAPEAVAREFGPAVAEAGRVLSKQFGMPGAL